MRVFRQCWKKSGCVGRYHDTTETYLLFRTVFETQTGGSSSISILVIGPDRIGLFLNHVLDKRVGTVTRHSPKTFWERCAWKHVSASETGHSAVNNHLALLSTYSMNGMWVRPVCKTVPREILPHENHSPSVHSFVLLRVRSIFSARNDMRSFSPRA